MPRQISIQNARIIDNFYLWEAFSGINNSRSYSDFKNTDNYWLYLQILATVGGSGMDIKGSIDCSGNPNYPVGAVGDVYRVSVAGKIGGAAGFPVSVGDSIICFVASAAGTQAAVGANWNIKQVGLQRIFETDLATGDVTQTGLRDWTATIARDHLSATIRDSVHSAGGNYSFGAVGTWSVSGTNFTVLSNAKILAGVTATRSLSIGFDSGFDPTLIHNTFIGVRSGKDLTTGTYNTAVGSSTLQAITTGAANVVIGALSGTTISTGNSNTVVGYNSMTFTTGGSENVAIGVSTLVQNTTGNYNVAVGGSSLASATTADFNTAVGRQSMQLTTTGASNVAVGGIALQNNTTGSSNTAIGLGAGFGTTTGSGGVFLGNQAGYYETGSNKLFIDNTTRTNEADGRLKSLVYGIFDALTTNQFFTVNGHLLVREDLQFTTKAIDTTAGDSVTINSPAGRFRKDTSGTTFTLTNSFITANSIIQLTPANAAIDATATTWTILAGVGSAVIEFNGAPTANFDMNFLVIN